MEELFYYYEEDAEKKAKEIAAEIGGIVENQSCEKIYDCEPMDKKAEAIINNSVSGDTGAFWVYDKDYNLAAIVAHWISRDANLNISIEDFADGVNEQTFYPGEIKEIIEYNGWDFIASENFATELFEKDSPVTPEELELYVETAKVIDNGTGKQVIIKGGVAEVKEYINK